MCGHTVSKDSQIRRIRSAKSLQEEHGHADVPVFVHVAVVAHGAPGRHKRQSPVNIVTSNAFHDNTLLDGKFKINYSNNDFSELLNTGHGWQINLKPNSTSTLEAVHLNGLYKVKQLHCHWGDKSLNGSEHTINGVHYAGEIHIVHYKQIYGSFEAATKHTDGLAVIAIFLQENAFDNPDLAGIVKLMSKTKYKDETAKLAGCNINHLFPENREFWTYEGSLTTSPFTECVIWTIFRSAIPISRNQLDVFRSLFIDTANGSKANPVRCEKNARPVQPVNDRQIRSSF